MEISTTFWKALVCFAAFSVVSATVPMVMAAELDVPCVKAGCSQWTGCTPENCGACTTYESFVFFDNLSFYELTASVKTGLACESVAGTCPESGCQDGDDLSATGRITISHYAGNDDGYDLKFAVCERIHECSGQKNCPTCQIVEYSAGASAGTQVHDLGELTCTNCPDAACYQYQLQVFVFDDQECTDNCDSTEADACDLGGECNLLGSSSFAFVSSCCLEIP